MDEDLTNFQGHYKLWNYLAETGSKYKHEVFCTMFPDKKGLLNVMECFACAEAGTLLEVGFHDSICDVCPIDWQKTMHCHTDGSYYCQWCDAKTVDERKLLATIIRDLPWNKTKKREENKDG